MRTLILTALLTGCVALGGCEQSSSQAAAPAAPEKPKSLARSAPMYAGQEQILSVSSGKIEVDDGNLILHVEGATATPGWSDPAFLPRVYAAQPKDGIYEVDVIATKPTGAAAQAVTPIEVEKAWPGYKKDRLKGVKFMTKTNEVVAMLPAAEQPAAGS
ncbi:hypothetical protein [Phenylobacterium sp. J367]|uniref:hypothetical protein n=1 Tax=Phenylobacterium sp. J367 TaxID=2898435 RepID=UPI0021517A29|nr:hypothetical protein [Phenylobacterium sp. J367]MCR5878620.1 hypothetical protein [Phenylobacterium sp. J367]